MLNRLWGQLFLDERPSFGLPLFRPFVAFATTAHVLPTFFHMEDIYLRTAFKAKNLSFFTPEVIAWVEKSPDSLIIAMAVLFCLSALTFGIGLFTQASCITMTVCCYFFYALNALHIGTLSYDILLVTLFLMCVTPTPGDSLSLDCLRKTGSWTTRRSRPFFIQRLLQMQIAATYFYTALWKIMGNGNWLTDNPLYYLFNSTPEGVVKAFPFRDFFSARPDLCYAIGIGVILFEFTFSFLVFWKRTRTFFIIAACAFHVMLLVTLHVPTIFFFLFPPQLLLFLEPKTPER